MKKILTVIAVISLSSAAMAYAGNGIGVYLAGVTYGKGNDKAAALATALARVPNGAFPSHVGYNGYSYSTSNGTSKGSYTCVISWKKIHN